MIVGVGSRGCLSSGVGSSDAYLVVLGCFFRYCFIKRLPFCNIWSNLLDNLAGFCLVVLSQEDVWVFW